LASANRILRRADLPPDRDVPSPIDENTYRRYEHEGKVDAPPFSEDICADYDYIRAIDVLIYGMQPLLEVPVDVSGQRTSRVWSRWDIAPVRRRTSNKHLMPAGERVSSFSPSVASHRKSRKKNVKTEAKISAKAGTKKRNYDERRSIFFQFTHIFGKPS